MNKHDLVVAMGNKANVSQKVALEMLDAIMEAIADGLVTEGLVRLNGFGTFEVKKRAERTGRNPQTGEEILITARKAPVFKPSKNLKEAVKNS